MRPGAARTAFAITLALAAFPGFSEYPQLKSLTRDDPLYLQLEATLEDDYRATQDRHTPPEQRAAPPPLSFFGYRPKDSEDLFSMAARIGTTYESLVSLNGVESVASFNALERILVPSRAGLFVTDPARTALEDMMLSTRRQAGLSPQRVMVERGGRREALWFFASESFNQVERAYFLRVLHLFPINRVSVDSPVRGSITSDFGERADPFSGHPEFHNGVDIGAPTGTEVRAARDGTVAERGTSPILGTYVVLSHPDGWQTIYGHLSSASATLGEQVSEGATIGRVGSTGRATGPHLHFEVRHGGDPVDPEDLLAVQR